MFIINAAKRDSALVEIVKLKEREGVHLSENTKLQATLNQLEKVKEKFVFIILLFFYLK